MLSTPALLALVIATAPPAGDDTPGEAPATQTDPSDPSPLDPPEVQRPSETPEAAAEAQPEAAPDTEAPAEPAEAPADEPEAKAEPAAEQPALPESSDMSNLLESDEAEARRVRVRVDDSAREGVDHRERMRSYYARIYRPEHNPSRLYFAARAAYGLSDTRDGAGGRGAFANVEFGQTWNHISYAVGPTLFAGAIDIGDTDDDRYSPLLVGGGPSLGLGRLSLMGRGFVDFRLGYNFFYAAMANADPTQPTPAAAAPHGPKAQLDMGLLFHGSERRRFRHGLGATMGWQMLVHSIAGDFPVFNNFTIGATYFFG